MARLDGKAIIMTGSTQGLGEAIALDAADSGAAGVVVCGRQEQKGAAVVEKLNDQGSNGLFVRADLQSEADCRNIVRKCDERFGRVDGLVNAAADTNRGTIEDTTVEFWDYQFNVNVRAPFILLQECVKVMRRENIAGSVVNILSVAAYCGLPKLMSYSTTKGALSIFTKNNAHALRQYRIRVNGINLGWTDTPNEHVVQIKEGQPENWLEIAEQESPFGRIMKPEDAAKLCTFLLSDDSGIMTGSNIDCTHRVMGVFPPEMVD